MALAGPRRGAVTHVTLETLDAHHAPDHHRPIRHTFSVPSCVSDFVCHARILSAVKPTMFCCAKRDPRVVRRDDQIEGFCIRQRI